MPKYLLAKSAPSAHSDRLGGKRANTTVQEDQVDGHTEQLDTYTDLGSDDTYQNVSRELADVIRKLLCQL